MGAGASDLFRIYSDISKQNELQAPLEGIVPEEFLPGGKLCISYETDVVFESSPFTGERIKDDAIRKLVIIPDTSNDRKYFLSIYEKRFGEYNKQSTRPVYVCSVGKDYVELTIKPEEAMPGILGLEVLTYRVYFKVSKISAFLLHRGDTQADYFYVSKVNTLNAYIEACKFYEKNGAIDALNNEISGLVIFLGGPSRLAMLKEVFDKEGLTRCFIQFIQSGLWQDVDQVVTASEISLYYLYVLINNAVTQTEAETYQNELLELVSIARPYLLSRACELVSSKNTTEESSDRVLDKLCYYAARSQAMRILSKRFSKENDSLYFQALEYNKECTWNVDNAWDIPEELESLANIIEKTLCKSFTDRKTHLTRAHHMLGSITLP